MRLIDEVTIKIQSGAGGNGCISFRREKYVPRGGPNGGNGGRGGDVILESTRDKGSLLDFKYRPKYEGERGEHGMGSDCDGRGGEDLIIQVPLGTMVHDLATGELVVDLIEHGQRYQIAKGGKGGRGNMTFATSTNRAPRFATPGEAGELKDLRLELRLLADVGLIGLPNAGKSSFLRTVSRATPKIADYPFTTLEPHLGVVDNKGQAFIIADLPGLIEGASEGAGLGHKFLKHVSRNRMLLHLVDCTNDVETIEESVRVIRAELEAYDVELGAREQWLVFTKTDLLTAEDLEHQRSELKARGLEGFFVSSQTSAGISVLLDALSATSQTWRKAETIAPAVIEEMAEQQELAEQQARAAASEAM